MAHTPPMQTQSLLELAGPLYLALLDGLGLGMAFVLLAAFVALKLVGKSGPSAFTVRLNDNPVIKSVEWGKYAGHT